MLSIPRSHTKRIRYPRGDAWSFYGKGFVQCHENDIPLDSAIDIKNLSQKSEITVLFLEIRIIGDKHINIYIPSYYKWK
jgi:hypothetical protein